MNLEEYSELIDLATEIGLDIVIACLIMIAGWIVGNSVSKRIHRVKKLDDTIASFLGGVLKYGIIAVAAVSVLGQFGVQTASLLAVLGAAGLAIGLSLQGTLSNVAAGTMLLILRPFKLGDFITVGGTSGTVKSLGLFGTELSTTDNVYIFMPNNQIFSNEIQNFSRNTQRRQDIMVGISYDDDISKAIKVLEKTMAGDDRVLKKPDEKKASVITTNMGESSVDMVARFWCKREDYWGVRSDLTRAIKEALDKEGISIPFPSRTMYMASPPAEEKPATKKKKAA